MEQHRIDFKKLRAEVSFKYGIELDETTLTVLLILTRELNRQHTKMNKSLEEMAEDIQCSKQTLQVDTAHPRWQAFWHGMGQWGLGICLTALLTFAIISLDWNRERKEKKALQHQLEWYQKAYRFLQKEHLRTATNTNKKKPKNK